MKTKIYITVIFVLVAFSSAITQNVEHPWSVQDRGGGNSNSPALSMTASIGQGAIGTSSIEFSYRIVAKRLGYENKRLEKINPPGLSTIDEKIKETIIRDLPLDSNRNEQFR